MKILFVSSSNGASVRTIKYLKSYVRQRYLVEHVGWDRTGEDPPVVIRYGVKHRAIFRGGGYGNLKLVFALPFWMLRLFVALLKGDFDLIHVADWDSAFVVAVASVFNHRPFIYDIYDTFALRHNFPSWLKRLLMVMDQWVMRRAAAVIIVDENRRMGIPLDVQTKLHVIYNCPNDISASLGDSPQIVYDILASGHLARYRGIDMLLEAAHRMPSLRIVMAGRVNDPLLEAAIRSCPQVDFRGWITQEEVLQLCRQSRLIYSLYDPSTEINRRAASNKWYDAMMAGRPVVVNSEVLNSECIKEWDIGYLIPYGDVDALLNIVSRVRSSPQEATDKGLRGRQLFEKQFNWDLMERKIIGLVEQIVAERVL